MAIYKIDGNFTGLAFAEEDSIGKLPAAPVYYDVEINDYKDFGGQLSTVARSIIEPSRQKKKGTVTDLDASGGYGIDLTRSNMLKLLQGFFFADAYELKTTKPLNSVQIAVTGSDGSDSSFAAAAGMDMFVAGELVLVSGFAAGANNGLKRVVSSAAGKLTVAGSLVTEVGTSKAIIQKVGVEFAPGDASLTKVGDQVSLELAVGSFASMDGVIPGAWVYVGGDTSTSKFGETVGYARIGSVSAKKVIFDQLKGDVTVSDAGAGQSIQMFLGLVIKNEKNPSLIKRRSYNLERTLGVSDIGVQAEYLKGAVPNELTLTTPVADKVTMDLAFMAIGYYVRSGAVGDTKEVGTHIASLGEECYNTSSSIPSVALTLFDASKSSQTELFAYCEGFTIGLNNNISVDKAVGVLGGFDMSVGEFDVTASSDGYFADVNALRAIRNNADVGANVIMAQKNYGIVFDIPLGTVSGGQLNVEKGTSIKTALEFAGAENRHGYTMLVQSFAYLPQDAMSKE